MDAFQALVHEGLAAWRDRMTPVFVHTCSVFSLCLKHMQHGYRLMIVKDLANHLQPKIATASVDISSQAEVVVIMLFRTTHLTLS